MAERALTAAQTPSPQWFARVHYTDPQPDEATVERYIAARRLWRRDRDWASLARDTCSLSVDWPAMFLKILERERHEVDGEEDPKDETADGVKPSAVVVSTPPPTSGDSGVLQLERHDDEEKARRPALRRRAPRMFQLRPGRAADMESMTANSARPLLLTPKSRNAKRRE